MGNAQSELDAAEAAVRSNPDDPWLRKCLVEALLLTGNVAQAERHLRVVRDRAPSQRWSIELEATVARASGDVLRWARAQRQANQLKIGSGEIDPAAFTPHPAHPSRPLQQRTELRLIQGDGTPSAGD